MQNQKSEIRNQKFLVLGLARQGLALARWLTAQGARVTLSDAKPVDQLQSEIESLRDLSIDFALGGHPIDLLSDCDVLCLSGGVPIDLPIVLEAKARSIPLTNDAQLFVERCPAPIAGITGSAGKTTTTTLVGEMSKAAKFITWVGGNIGNPLISDLDKIVPGDKVIMELSSFQLELMTSSPQVAAILNVTPNHLDRHPSMEAYLLAKRHILDYQSLADTAILGYDDLTTRKLSGMARGYVRFFSREKMIGRGAFVKDDRIVLVQNHEIDVCGLNEIKLRGAHNVLNILAACAIASAMNIEPEAMRAAILQFTGVAHRLQLVREWKGVKFYDDSIATAPERLMADLQAFDEPIVLLAGGRDKHLPWQAAAHLIVDRVKHLIVFGEMAELVRTAVEGEQQSQGGALEQIHSVASLEESVGVAARVAKSGDVVLLSPGGTSFDAFKDFAERGDKFQQLVQALT
jgi:UDP-N-acetylmuramoylalanine--D-glutamate ligase